MNALRTLLWIATITVLNGGALAQPTPLSTAVTYQGQLKQSGSPVSSTCDLQFSLWDDPTSTNPANQIGGTLTFSGGNAVSISNGLFTVQLDFGAAAFTGDARWLQVGVACPSGGPFTTLGPRQQVLAAPYALFARTAPWSGLLGVPAGFADGIDDVGGLVLPFSASAASSTALFAITQTGDGPAALFKVQPQPEPPMPMPAIEAISAISAPAIKATNTGGGSALDAVRTIVGPPIAPVIRATNNGSGSALEAVSQGVPDPVDAPTIQATNLGDGPALDAVRGHVGPPEAPVIRATNDGGGQGIQATNNGSAATIEATNNGDGPAAVFIIDPELTPAPAIRATNTHLGSAALFEKIGGIDPGFCPTIDATNKVGGSAIEAVSQGVPDPIEAPTIQATNLGAGPAIDAVRTIVGPPDAPVIRATNNGSGSAIEAVSQAIPDPISAPTIQATNLGGGPALDAVRINVGPPSAPVIRATNTGLGMAVEAASADSAATMRATNTGSGPALEAVRNNVGPPSAPVIRATNNGLGMAVEAASADSAATMRATNTGGGPGVYASATSGNAIHGISTAGSAGYFEGNVHLTGNLTKAYTTGTSSRAAPIAYASIDGPTGMVTAGTPNVSSVWDSANLRYVITIAGEAYSSTGYITTVTPIAGAAPEALFAVTSSGSGQLRVRIMSPPSGTTGLQRPFQFITYKP